MPLHPKIETLLASMARLGMRPISETPLPEARAYMEESSRLLGPFDEVEQIEDRTVPGPAGEIPIRIYRPAGEQLPVVVYFHGGGWVLGSVNSHDGYSRALAKNAKAVVVSVGYRLAPEHPYPAAVEDAYAATSWVYENAQELGGRSGAVGVAGDSAGGNLAAAVSLMARDRGTPAIGCQILIYPITDCSLDTPSYHDFAEGYFLTRDSMRWFWDQYCPDEAQRQQAYLSPLRAESSAGLPPALILTAEYDPLRDEAEAYAEKLREAGVEAKSIRYEGMIHGFTRRFHLLEEAQEAMRETVAMVHSHL